MGVVLLSPDEGVNMSQFRTAVVAFLCGAVIVGGGAAAYAAGLSHRSTAAYPCPTRSLSQRVTCIEATLTRLGPGGSGSVLAAREVIRNWCVSLLHQVNIDTGSDAVSLLLSQWKLDCGAFRR